MFDDRYNSNKKEIFLTAKLLHFSRSSFISSDVGVTQSSSGLQFAEKTVDKSIVPQVLLRN